MNIHYKYVVSGRMKWQIQLLAVHFKKGIVIFVMLPWHPCPGHK